jgi:DNA-binding CsgD family transcriptional regulator
VIDPCPALRSNPFDDRETRILREVADGRTPVEIAPIVGCTRNTVTVSLQRMRVRISARTPEQLVATALRKDWIK